MNNFSTARNHPLISNSNQYFFEKQYVSINSEDRDVNKYPSSAEFEIELPRDYLNVASAKLYSWGMPSNYDVFSIINSNVSMTFKFTTLYNPGQIPVNDPLTEGIFDALYNNINAEYVVIIESGFYNPDQMETELTNKFNEIVTITINDFFEANPITYAIAKSLFLNYDRFNIVYNSVGQKLWFGNTADKFVITNESNIYTQRGAIDSACLKKNILPDFSDWGLPSYLGFVRCNIEAQDANQVKSLYSEFIAGNYSNNNSEQTYPSVSGDASVPRFYYGDANQGDDGFWLLPTLPGATVFFLQAPLKINFMGPAYIYMEIDGLNCIDETVPYNISRFTTTTNQTNGIVNSCFAKIPVILTPIAQYFDTDSEPYKYFNPPAERLRKLKIKIRYHNGQLVNFASFNYSFMIEFNLLNPQPERAYSIRDSYNLGQINSK